MILLGKNVDWASAKRTMMQLNFKNELRDLDPATIRPQVVKFLNKEFISDESFAPKIISKVSHAAGVMCVWVRAITVYAQILHEVSKRVDRKVKKTMADHAYEISARQKLSSQRRSERPSERQILLHTPQVNDEANVDDLDLEDVGLDMSQIMDEKQPSIVNETPLGHYNNQDNTSFRASIHSNF